MTRLYDDRHVLDLPAPVVVDAMRAAIRAHGQRRLEAPPRAVVPLGDGRMVFTVGAVPGEVAGFRAYGVGTDAGDDQLVAVWQAGALTAVIVGEQLGIRRTAGIGAVATDVLAPHRVRTLALIGSGRQACAHAREVSAVRDLEEIRVYSRSASRREAAARWIESSVGVSTVPSDSAEEATTDADLVTLATSSMEPVIDPETVRPGAHVTSLGPKFKDRHELPVEIADRAAVVATDSLAQVEAYDAPFFLHRTEHTDRIVELRDLLQGKLSRGSDDVTLFCSVGLSGTEPFLAQVVADHHDDPS